MLRKWASLAVLSLIASVASAQPQTYAQRGTQIRAGIVIIDSSQVGGVPQNPTPHVWYNLDSNRNVKPAGWNIYNPNAPTQATQPIVSRWAILGGGGQTPAVGDQITKRMAAYWEVFLSQTSDAQLAQYDVLFLNATGNVALNPLEREKLRQFVDRGGVLWVEMAGVNTGQFTDNSVNNFPIPFGVTTSAGTGNLDQFNPLMNYPYQFDISNLDYLNGSNNLALTQAVPPFNNSLEAPISSDWFRLKPVVLAGGNATMMVGRIGDGFMVVTTRNAAGYLNQIHTAAGFLPNQGYYAIDPRGGLDKGSDVLGRLAINMISLGSGSETVGAGSRKMGSTPNDISAPLLQRYNDLIPNSDPGLNNNFPSATYKGLVVVSAFDRIYVYDAKPSQDLDGDNNPDDGIQDYSLGNNMDLLWVSQQLTGPISAPTCVEVAQPAAGVPTDQILVTDAAGAVVSFAAFPTNAAGQIIGNNNTPFIYKVAAPPDTNSEATIDQGAISHGAYAPTYQEGLVYVAHNLNAGIGNVVGQLWVMDPAQGVALNSGGNRWLVGDSTNVAFNEVTASPTVGYIPIADNSGGLDKVVYLPTRANNSLNAGIYSTWVGVRGESPTSVTATGTTLSVTTRAMAKGLSIFTGAGSLGVKLTVLKPTGDPLTATEMSALFDGTITQGAPGILDFGLTGAWNPTYSVRIDYTLDWGRGPGFSASLVRGSIFLPDTSANKRTILGNIAMSPRGTIYVVHSTAAPTGVNPGGAFYAFREQGQGAFKCLARYDVAGPHNVVLNQAGTTSVAATVSDRDEVINFAPIIGGTVSSMTFMTGPVVKGDLVYAAAEMRKTNPVVPFAGFIPYTVLMAFKSEPDAPEIKVGDLSDGFTIIQPDVLRSTSKTNPTTMTLGAGGQYQYIRESGKIRFDSLMAPNRGGIQNIFNLSEPVIIRSGGRADTLVYPDATAGSNWSPLAWYVVLHGTTKPTNPVVTGGTLFIGGASGLPTLLLGGNPINTTGVLFGINADISERDPMTVSDPDRPWLRQVWTVRFTGGFQGNSNIRWPQNQGITSFQDWQLRVLQAAMLKFPGGGGGGRAMSLAAGDDGLFAMSGAAIGTPGADSYLYGFSRADFLVCDEGRLARFDPAGNPIFATDVSNTAGAETSAGSTTAIRPLQRPVRAYPVGVSDTVAVDPAQNRVVRLDRAGRELRSIENFRLDTASNIQLAANEPTTLNNPRDVAYYTEYVANPTGVSSPQAVEYWVHYVIADSGNRRILDLIDRYYVGSNKQIGDVIQDANGVRQLGVLRWHSPSEYSGKRFEYNAITRVPGFYIAGIGSALPTRVDAGLDNPGAALPRESQSGNGGIVIFNLNNPLQTQVINEVTVPATGANVYIDPNTLTYDPAARAAHQKTLSNLSSVTVRSIVGPTPGTSLYAIMFTDATGVYEISSPGGTAWVVDWMLPNEAYKFLRNVPGAPPAIFANNPLQLRATYARRLDSGEVLIVNGYVGKYRDSSQFTGEVVQVNGDIFAQVGDGFDWNSPNLGFDYTSVRFQLPPITGTRGLYQPVFADRR